VQSLPIEDSLKGRLKDVLVERSWLCLGRNLGSGEFGMVYEGVLRQMDGPDLNVAVKTTKALTGFAFFKLICPKDRMQTVFFFFFTILVGIDTQSELESFLKEAELMRNFDHPNVLRLLGISFESSLKQQIPTPMVILPFMKHGDLRSFLLATRHGDIPVGSHTASCLECHFSCFPWHGLSAVVNRKEQCKAISRRSSISAQTLVSFMIDIVSGMEYLSSKGFLHRDLAARNCMLQDDLKVSVADFGLSKKTYSSNYYRQKVMVRMPVKWMAIESLSESIFTTKSDVYLLFSDKGTVHIIIATRCCLAKNACCDWSFGITMWEIFSRGKTPYPGVQNHEMYDFLQEGHRLKKPTECLDKLYNTMCSCWLSDPNHRPTFSELKETLQEVLPSLPSSQETQGAQYLNMGPQHTNLEACVLQEQDQNDR
uniref:Protein kinase domain-containing protein n=1 Tax=Latimeria chalumnae TaxID=7897 RepID=H3AD07_LATCH